MHEFDHTKLVGETASSVILHAARAHARTVNTKNLSVITDLDTMTATYQVRHNGGHVCTTSKAPVAVAAYNGIRL